jgi:hypothetical protein
MYKIEESVLNLMAVILKLEAITGNTMLMVMLPCVINLHMTQKL